jgi:hypothetical protein
MPIPQPQNQNQYPGGLNYNPVIYIGTQPEMGGGSNTTVVANNDVPEPAPPVTGGGNDVVATNLGEVDFNRLVIRKV